MMTSTPLSLQIEYLHGRIIAAYLTLPHRGGVKSHRSRRFEPDMLVDFSRGGRPLGIELLAPRRASLAALNRVMRRLGMPLLRRDDVAPLKSR